MMLIANLYSCYILQQRRVLLVEGESDDYAELEQARVKGGVRTEKAFTLFPAA